MEKEKTATDGLLDPIHDERKEMSNVLVLLGNLASAPEKKVISETATVCTFLLAVDRPLGKEKRAELKAAGKQTADFIRVNAWNAQAEACAQYLNEGDRVLVEGGIRSRTWEAEDGTTRGAVDVNASSVTFLTPPKGNGNGDAEIEAAATGAEPPPEAPEPAESAQGATQPETDDDIPF